MGWSEQPGERTIEGELKVALQTTLRRPVELTVAGRTDRGVHALAQVCSYEGALPSLRSVNALLPHEISVVDAQEAPDGFSARRDAKSRTYVYRVLARRTPSPFWRGRAVWWPHACDFAALEACGQAVRGRHDFTAFTPTETHHQRFVRDILEARWERHGELLEFWIEADSFMRHMNRILLGTMLEVASGRRLLEDFRFLLTGAPRSAAGVTAPPHGLYLASVRY